MFSGHKVAGLTSGEDGIQIDVSTPLLERYQKTIEMKISYGDKMFYRVVLFPVTDKKLQCQQKRGTLANAGIRDISSMTGFPSTLVHRIAATWVKRQYLSQDPVTKNYSLSLRFLERKTDYEDLIL